jgi:hypothetical protein
MPLKDLDEVLASPKTTTDEKRKTLEILMNLTCTLCSGEIQDAVKKGSVESLVVALAHEKDQTESFWIFLNKAPDELRPPKT